MSSSLQESWPELATQFAGREMEMPAESARVNRIMEMGPIFRRMNPDAYAVTGPLGTIALNRQLIEQDKQNLGDVLVHELTHVGQGKKGFLRQFYEPSKVEEEAINREATRNVIRGDINLPPSRSLQRKSLPAEPTSESMQSKLNREVNKSNDRTLKFSRK